MRTRSSWQSVLWLSFGLVLGAVASGAGLGAWSAMQPTAHWPTAAELKLHAMGASGGSSIAMTTAPVDDGMEGLFVLDFVTGDLQCWVINPRTGAVNSMFKSNAAIDLGVERGKTPDYVMVSGAANFRGGGAASQLANCVVYVADGGSGNVVAYAVPWQRALATSGAPQTGVLQRIHAGKARLVEVRP